MPDSDIQINAGSGTKVDTRTVGAGEDEHRQVIVIGSPTVAADVAPVNATSGLMVSVASNSAAVRVEQSVAASLNATVSATNLDIRDLSSASDSVTVAQSVAGNLNATVTGTVTVQDGGNVISVDDNSSSLTIDNAALSNTGSGTESGVLRVTIATDSTGLISVDDNNSSLTVDGTVTANLAAGDNNIGNVDIVTVPSPLSTTGGGTEATAHRVTIASDSTGVLSVDDNGSSLTVDGTVGITAGTGVGRPDSNGQTWVWKCVQSTTATTTNVWTPGSGKKIVLTYFQILASGTQDGDVQLWFAASGDTTYNRGTDQVVFDGHFEPSATAAPGIALTGIWPCATADYLLKVTTSAAVNPLTVVAWGYEI